MPPISASTQSKDKLATFRFGQKEDNATTKVPLQTDSHPAPQDNQRTSDSADVPNLPSSQATARQPLSQITGNENSRECPQTPAGRLTLTELVASCEDPKKQNVNLTPVERVVWENLPIDSSQGSSQERSSTTKNRKRPRSFSSEASSQKCSRENPHDKIAADLQRLQASLNTPNVDPASELWSRYSLKAREKGKLSPETPFAQSFSQLLNSSSPPTPAAHARLKESAGLRRSFSCGIEWPVSAAKRRKVKHNVTDLGVEVELDPERTTEPRPQSRLSELVDEIHDELMKPIRKNGREASNVALSSSLPDFSNLRHERAAEAATILQPKDPVHSYSKASKSSESPIRDAGATEIPRSTKLIDASSEFGEDDLDADMIVAMDNAASSHEPKASINTLQHTDLGKNAGKLSDAFSATPFAQDNQVDDFEDGSSDVFAADLEEVVALYDQGQRTEVERMAEGLKAPPEKTSEAGIIKQSANLSQVVEGSNEASDDEYGDDVDFGECFDQDIKPHQGLNVANDETLSVRMQH